MLVLRLCLAAETVSERWLIRIFCGWCTRKCHDCEYKLMHFVNNPLCTALILISFTVCEACSQFCLNFFCSLYRNRGCFKENPQMKIRTQISFLANLLNNLFQSNSHTNQVSIFAAQIFGSVCIEVNVHYDLQICEVFCEFPLKHPKYLANISSQWIHLRVSFLEP